MLDVIELLHNFDSSNYVYLYVIMHVLYIYQPHL